ncbi:MAG: hypothetical protein FWD86_03655, partial [Firmicutes bacterium]|nr:hypothetical protein [Bacillota bacterium]
MTKGHGRAIGDFSKKARPNMKQFEIEDEVEIKEKGNEPSEGRLDDEPASDTIQDQSPDITADDGQDQDFDMIAKDSSNDYLSLAKDHHDGGDENFFGGNDNGGDGGENDADPDSDHDKNEDQDDPVEAEEGSTENEMTDLIGSITDLIEKNNLKSLRTLLHQLDEVEALFIVNSLPRNHKVLVFRLL